MAGQTSGKSDRTTVTRGRTTVDTTAESSSGAPTADRSTTRLDARPTPEPSPRTGVGVSVPVVRTAFASGDASQSVGYIQHVLRSRGFDPGNVAGIADHQTRTALARFQQSIGEEPTGLPTDRDVDFLGFDIYG